MANPFQSKLIKVTCSGTGSAAGQPFVFVNRSNGDKQRGVLSSTKSAIIDCANFTNGWSDSQILELIVSGPAYGTTTITLAGPAIQTSSLALTEQTAPVTTNV